MGESGSEAPINWGAKISRRQLLKVVGGSAAAQFLPSASCPAEQENPLNKKNPLEITVSNKDKERSGQGPVILDTLGIPRGEKTFDVQVNRDNLRTHIIQRATQYNPELKDKAGVLADRLIISFGSRPAQEVAAEILDKRFEKELPNKTLRDLRIKHKLAEWELGFPSDVSAYYSRDEEHPFIYIDTSKFFYKDKFVWNVFREVFDEELMHFITESDPKFLEEYGIKINALNLETAAISGVSVVAGTGLTAAEAIIRKQPMTKRGFFARLLRWGAGAALASAGPLHQPVQDFHYENFRPAENYVHRYIKEYSTPMEELQKMIEVTTR